MGTIATFAITEAIQYGIPFVEQVIAALKTPGVTIESLDVMFAQVKPYAAFNIPAVAPTKPTIS